MRRCGSRLRTRAPARRPTAARTAAGSRRRGGRCLREQRSARLADLALAGQEDEDVAAAPLAPRARRRRRRSPRSSVVLVVGLVARRAERPVAHLDRIRAARDLDHRRRRRPPKCAAKRSASIVAEVTISFRSGRCGSSCLQVAEQEIDVEAALVRLVDDDRVVGARAADRPASRRAGCRRS